MRILGAILAVILLAVLTMTVSAGSMVFKLRFNDQAQIQGPEQSFVLDQNRR